MSTIVRIPTETGTFWQDLNLNSAQYGLPILTFGVGLFYWHGVNSAILLAVLLLGFFLMGRLNRWVAYASYATFHLGFTVPIIDASQTFLTVQTTGAYLLWLSHALLCALPFLALKGRLPGLRAAVVFLLFLVPPFGYLAPNNPALVVGALFPALGWVGLVLTAALIWAVAEINEVTAARWVAGLALLMATGSNAVWMSKPHEPPSNWHAGNTDLGNYADNITKRKDIVNLRLPIDFGIRAYEFRDHDHVWFLSEGLINDKEYVTETIWRLALKGSNATAIVGEYFRDKDGSMYSGVRVLGKPRDDANDLKTSKAAITFPVTLWHPWRPDDHFPMHTLNAPIPFDGQLLHLSWCAESTIVWPHLRASFLDRPTVMVSLENRWISKGTSLEDAQTAAARLNARFLGASLLQAINH